MRRISVLGATGSIGASTLDLVRRNRDAWRVVALTANGNVPELAALAPVGVMSQRASLRCTSCKICSMKSLYRTSRACAALATIHFCRATTLMITSQAWLQSRWF